MKKITPTILLAVLINQFSFGQDSSEIKNPVYELTIRTMNNNKMLGLLVNVTDSTLAIYPGTKSQLKKGMNFQRASFGYENIKEIKVKKKGVLSGTVSSKKARIDGDREKFKQFLTRID